MESDIDCNSIFLQAKEKMKSYEFEKALPIIHHALECYRSKGNQIMEFSSMIQEFKANRLTERLDECSDLMVEIDKFIENHKLKGSEDIEVRKDYISYHLQKVLYHRDKQQYENASKILSMLLKMLETNLIPDKFLRLIIKDVDSEMMLRLDKFDEALSSSNQLIDEIFSEYTYDELIDGDPKEMYNWLELLSSAYFRLGNLYKRNGLYLQALGHFQNSLTFEISSVERRKPFSTQYSILECRYNLHSNEYLKITNDYTDNLYSLDVIFSELKQLKSQIEKYNYYEILSSISLLLAEISNYQGNNEDTQRYFAEAHKYNENLKNKEQEITIITRLIHFIQHKITVDNPNYVTYASFIPTFLMRLEFLLTTTESKIHKVEGFFNLGQLYYNQENFYKAAKFIGMAYDKLKEYINNISQYLSVRQLITEKLSRLTIMWCVSISRVGDLLHPYDDSLLSSLIEKIKWNILEISQNHELSVILDQKYPQFKHGYQFMDSFIESIRSYSTATQKDITIVGLLLDYIPIYGSRVLVGILKSNKQGNVELGVNIEELSDGFGINYDIYLRTMNYDFEKNMGKTDLSKIKQIEYIKNTGSITPLEAEEMKKIVRKNALFVDRDTSTFEATIDSICRNIVSNKLMDNIMEGQDVFIIPYGEVQSIPLEYYITKKIDKTSLDITVSRDLSLQSLITRLHEYQNSEDDETVPRKYLFVDIPPNQDETFEEEVDFIVDLVNDPAKTIRLSKDQATKNKILNQLKSHGKSITLYHHSSHGEFPGNPIEQNITTSTTTPIDLESILCSDISFGCNSLVFLSACESGSIQNKLTSQSLGIPMGLSSKGVGSIIGTHRIILDDIALALSKKFYSYLVSGENSTKALKMAKNEIMSKLQNDQLEEYLCVVSYHHIGIPYIF